MSAKIEKLAAALAFLWDPFAVVELVGKSLSGGSI
jgi:hypothetical protein